LYFWTLIVAVLIFAVGGGASIYEGVHHLMDPTPQTNAFWNYLVLGTAVVFESLSFRVALHEFRGQQGNQGIWTAIRRSKDPTTFTVLFEDTAALLGLLVALIGISLGEFLGVPEFDGAASVVIGLILAAVAVILVYESRGLLIGEGADPQMLASIRALTEADPG